MMHYIYNMDNNYNIDNIKVKKPLTEEQKEARKKYQREYMVRRRKEDPDFAARQKASRQKSNQREEAKERERIRNRNRNRTEYFQQRYAAQKLHYAELCKKIEEMEGK